MPRLQHSNILRVVAMLVGPPMPDYPRRRYIYHFYPKMKGQSVLATGLSSIKINGTVYIEVIRTVDH